MGLWGLVFIIFGGLEGDCGGGRQPPNKPADFSRICVRTVFGQSVCSERTLLKGVFCVVEDFLGNVRSDQTDCPQTAGHWICEKSAGLFGGCLVFGVGVLDGAFAFFYFSFFSVTFFLFKKYNRYRPGRRSI